MAELKQQPEIEAKDRFLSIGKRWKELSKEEQEVWNTQTKAN